MKNRRHSVNTKASVPNSGEALELPSAAISQVSLLSLVILPPLGVVYGLGASWLWVIWGSTAWGLAVLLKIPLGVAAHQSVPSIRLWMQAAVSGLLSSIVELGVAAFFFNLNLPETLVLENILAFSVGAGSTESLFVLGAAYFDKPAADQITRWAIEAKRSFCVRHLLIIERLIALAGHVGSRGLICLAIYRGSSWPVAIALVSFALTDGLAAYGSLKKWDWFDPSLCRIFYTVCGSISAFEIIMFLIFAFLGVETMQSYLVGCVIYQM